MNSKETLNKEQQIIAIGASTGGPGAIVELLRGLSSDFTFPIIIAQHIEPGFTEGFVSWLNSLIDLEVVQAENGTYLQAGHVYVLKTDGLPIISNNGQFVYKPTTSQHLYIPNIDYFFSALASSNYLGIGILLTGMGEDGAIGLKQLAEKGWRTFVQKRETCVVSGMPSAALKICKKHNESSISQVFGVLQTDWLISKRCKNGKK